MPGHVLHIEIAQRVRSLLPAGDDVTNALYHGALAPDMGMLPGADRLITDLAHYMKTARLARALVSKASSDVEQAYAWGWVTHVLADSGLHPAINTAAGGQSWAGSHVMHMRVEFGLDFQRLDRGGHLGEIRLSHAFDKKGMKFLLDAYRQTYRIDLGPPRLLRAHRAATWAQRLLFSFGGKGFGRSPVRWLAAAWPGSIAEALTDSVDPTPDLLISVDSWLEEFPDRFLGLFRGGLENLADLNLDTGAPEGEPYPATSRTREALRERISGQKPAI